MHEGTPITPQEVTRLLRCRLPPDESLSMEMGVTAYRLADGRVLVLDEETGGGLLWDADRVRAILEEDNEDTHILDAPIPDAAEFIKAVPHYIRELRIEVGNDPPLDCRAGSLAPLDSRILSVGLEHWAQARRLAMLIAYLGEVIRNEARAQWTLVHDVDSGRDVPMLVDEYGNRYDPFTRLNDLICLEEYTEVDPDSESGPMTLAAASQGI